MKSTKTENFSIKNVTHDVQRVGDVKFEIPTLQVRLLVDILKEREEWKNADLDRAYDSFDKYGIGTKYFAPERIPMDFELTNFGSVSYVRFSPANYEGKMKLDELVAELGIN